jgi:3-hydroxyanthranilate 3,4-dioxygenase
MLLRVVDDSTFRDIKIKEGEMFLLPGMCLRARGAHSAAITNQFIHSFFFPPPPLAGFADGCTCVIMTGNTPHNPVRFADTVGIVIERVRPEGSIGTCHHYHHHPTLG